MTKSKKSPHSSPQTNKSFSLPHSSKPFNKYPSHSSPNSLMTASNKLRKSLPKLYLPKNKLPKLNKLMSSFNLKNGFLRMEWSSFYKRNLNQKIKTLKKNLNCLSRKWLKIKQWGEFTTSKVIYLQSPKDRNSHLSTRPLTMPQFKTIHINNAPKLTTKTHLHKDGKIQ